MTNSSTTSGVNALAMDGGDPFYSYKANLAGAPVLLWLRRDGLEWQVGRRAGLIRYDRVRRVRLSFRPASMQSYRFIAEIWPTDGPKIQIASTSWQGLTLQQRLDGPYAAFITELHRRFAAARSTASFRCGIGRATYGIGLAVVGVAMAAFAALMVKAALIAEWRAVAIIGVLFAMFGWQLGNHFVRNWPGDYRPDAIPPHVLPRA